MNGKFIIYALLVSLFSTMATWGKFIASPSGTRAGPRGSSWYSNTDGWGGSWGGGAGGHK